MNEVFQANSLFRHPLKIDIQNLFTFFQKEYVPNTNGPDLRRPRSDHFEKEMGVTYYDTFARACILSSTICFNFW